MVKDNNLKKRLHENREDLAGEHVFGDTGQIILFFIFLIVWIADSFFLKYSVFIAEYIPLAVRIIAAGIVLIFSAYFAKSGLNIVFDEVREKAHVIRKGVFCRVRHPVYFGSILLYLGLFLFTLSMITLALCIIIIGFYYYISSYEEKILVEKFGKEYQDYMNKVPMFIPKIRK